jgi:hypothetical protein
MSEGQRPEFLSLPPDSSSARHREAALTPGSPFFCLLFFGEAKKSEAPAGARPGPQSQQIKRKKTIANKDHPTLGMCKKQSENVNETKVQGNSVLSGGADAPLGPTIPSRAFSDCGWPVRMAA